MSKPTSSPRSTTPSSPGAVAPSSSDEQAPTLADFDLHLFSEGRHWHTQNFLGAHQVEHQGSRGVRFAVWAPNADRVSVIGDFNDWDAARHPMQVRPEAGIWEIFIPAVEPGALYKFAIRNRDSGEVLTKTDPYGRRFELRPNTAAIVEPPDNYRWQDAEWMEHRRRHPDFWQHQPMSIYEVHLGSWQLDEHGQFLDYRTLAHRLVDHVRALGFTHIELLPITEHPFDGSWGYQTTGYFAPTSRFGSPDDFRYFVDHCHCNGIGVILDWVPAHFPRDEWALARFDGTQLYEHADPRQGEHRDWGTLIFNFGRNEVRSFLLASALYWLETFHLDGLRVDAVASMLYLDYSREDGDWIPNIYGGNENLEAISFLREMNSVTHGEQPGTCVLAEESTSWPQVTRPTYLGGLGFTMKWNMGWMHDTLTYMREDPVHRRYHHDQLTFGMLYAFTENFVLPFSHDEVVHGKGSLLQRMPGDDWQAFANLRLLYAYQFTYPGKKLLFMGCEFAQRHEWSETRGLDWHELGSEYHRGIQQLIADLNALYSSCPALHHYDFDHRGFAWADCHDSDQSVLSYYRYARREGDRHGREGDREGDRHGREGDRKGDRHRYQRDRHNDQGDLHGDRHKEKHHDYSLVALNFTPVPRFGYRLGVPQPGFWQERLNSDAACYGGSNLGNGGGVMAEEIPWSGQPYSVSLTLPPLAAVVLVSSSHDDGALGTGD
ncbi:1,4-alpha-glucan branching protein GlgB [Halorhodospira halochloris]|uniref:1,4-alpha-glucan branching protein GlgB n=1 Tax=Halorhodospira halochloris TaxID=1052 RepID=UPI001EE8BC4C|nr:1,4-alpha-glucan branching protein GlgB [Halorhodospira halochloris]